ncbi:MAG: clostripain-related cysteine peptidase, partial [Candidatus Cloacimonadales bacterium]
TSCSWNDPEPDAWTILIYMAADNSLSDKAEADIAEMMLTEIPDDVNVIVQVDFSELSSSPEAKRLRIRENSQQQIANLGEIDSGSYQELSEFIAWGQQKYPAQRTALIIWSHGNGWLPGYNKFCPDNQSGNFIDLTQKELSSALQNSNLAADIIALDACNMMNVEVIEEVADYTDYVLGSERSIPAAGFPYSEILPHFWNFSQTEIISDRIIFSFVNSYMPFGSQNPYGDDLVVSGSVAKSSEYFLLREKLQEFAAVDYAPSEIDQLQNARAHIEIEFNDMRSDIDLKDYYTKLSQIASEPELSASAELILSQIGATFVSQYFHDSDNLSYPAGSATIWWPDVADTYFNLLPLYSELNFAEQTGWDNFLNIFFE